ncbi:MAG: hypothetical protein BWY95_02165 [Bacteroidetes bacterium ADurb.BinA104]|nr:MAG: hypothetical protein BWY95_02165 [Bacteroidetes bacterium ADurb.BinA104]
MLNPVSTFLISKQQKFIKETIYIIITLRKKTKIKVTRISSRTSANSTTREVKLNSPLVTVTSNAPVVQSIEISS